MKRVKYNDVTEWFSLNNYDYILGLTVRHVIAEVFAMDLHSSGKYRKDDSFSVMPFPLVGDITIFDEGLEGSQLSSDCRGLYPICFEHLCSFVNSCLMDGRITINESGKLEPKADIAHCDIYNQPMRYSFDDPTSDGTTGIFVDIGLDLMSDDEMISSFKILLRKWREQAGMPERSIDVSVRFGSSTIAKIHQYRVIPYLDIARWARINGVTVSNDLYARLLFPNPLPNGEVKGGAHIRDTVKPFAEKACDFFNSVHLKKYYAENPHIENMIFSDFLTLNDFQ